MGEFLVGLHRIGALPTQLALLPIWRTDSEESKIPSQTVTSSDESAIHVSFSGCNRLGINRWELIIGLHSEPNIPFSLGAYYPPAGSQASKGMAFAIY